MKTLTKTLLFLSIVFQIHYLSAQFQLNGNGTQANLGGGCYRLTTASNTKYGSMWFNQKADLTHDFDMSANLNFGTNDATGADGIVFAFQGYCSSAGGIGGGMGITGITPSLFVEFDTYQNSDKGDPVADHMAVLKNGIPDHTSSSSLVSPVPIDPNSANVENGADWLVRVVWTASDTTLRVYVNNNLRITYSGNVVSSIFSGNPYVYWGFTAATGGYNNVHKVCMVTYPTNVVKLSDISICQGDSQQVNLPGGANYSWTPNYHISSVNTSNPTVYPDTTTTYIVSITDACNNVHKDTITVTVNPKPMVSLSLPFSSVCVNAGIKNLSGGTPTNGVYSGVGVSGTNFNPSVAGVGTHAIVYAYTNTFGCVARDTAWVQVTQLPNVSMTSIAPVCKNSAPITLSGGTPSGGTYSGTQVNNGIFTPSTAGNYTIYYTVVGQNGCVGKDSTGIVVYDLPQVNIQSSSSVICNGSTVNLTINSSAGDTYQWFLNGNSITNISGSNTSYAATQAGSYTVVTQNAHGCSSTSPAYTLTTGVNPVVNLTASDTAFCSGNSIILTSSLGANETAVWYRNNTVINGQSGATLTVSQSGDYSVKITSATGCAVTSVSIHITELPVIQATLTAPQTTFCPGTNSITLTANGTNASYVWFKDNQIINGANTSTYPATTPGTYTVQITLLSSSCSTTSNSLTLITGSTPATGITVPDTMFCAGTTLTLSAIAINGANYQWFLNGNAVPGSGNTLQANQAGTYHYQVTNPEGCSHTSAPINLHLLPATTVSLYASQTVLCTGNSVTLTASMVPNANYEWFRNGVSLGAPSTAQTYTITQPGNYQVKAYAACVGISNTITITNGTLPSNAGSISGASSQCPGADDDYSISAVTGAISYLWEIIPSNAGTIAAGQGTTNITVHFLNTNASIKVTPINNCGNGTPATLAVTISNSLCFDPLFGGYPTNICPNASVTFTNYTNSSQYVGLTPKWTFGAGANPATGSGNGPFTVTYNTSGLKTVVLSYVDPFGNPAASTTKTDYIYVSAGVNTSAISGPTNLSSCTTTETYSVTNVQGSTFQWTVPANATILSGQGTSEIMLSFNGTAGSIQVVQTNGTGCVGAAVTLQTSCTITSIEEQTYMTFEIMPNPSKGVFYVHQYYNTPITYTVMNLSGQTLIQETAIVTPSFTLDLSEIPNGMYFIHLSNGQQSEVKKIIIQR